MREHMGLFRGKWKGKGEWVEGGLYEGKEMHESVFFIVRTAVDWPKEQHAIPPAEFYLVDPATVGECTSMCDKNGKLIFEGDICRACLNPEICTATVTYMNDIASFGWLCDEDTMLLPIDMKVAKNKVGDAVWVEIIGNIHDNPELLEGAGEKE